MSRSLLAIFKIWPFLSQKSQFTYRIFSIVWLSNVNTPRLGKFLPKLLLCKAKSAWIIKRSIHYVTLQHYNPGELLKKIPPYLKRDFWYKRSKFWKLHCLRKMALESKCLHQIHSSWCHFAGKRMFYSLMHSLIWLVHGSFDISDRKCCILSGPPCISNNE